MSNWDFTSVAVTTEVSIAPFGFRPMREMNPEIGLALINCQER